MRSRRRRGRPRSLTATIQPRPPADGGVQGHGGIGPSGTFGTPTTRDPLIRDEFCSPSTVPFGEAESVRRLGIRHQTALPMRELSALALRAGPSGQSQLLAVGEDLLVVLAAGLEEGGEPAGTRRHDLRLPLRDT